MIIFCEIGLNHLGSEVYAREYLNELCISSVEGITFQVRENNFYKEANNSDLKLSKEFYHQSINEVKAAGKKIGIALAEIDLVDFFIENDADFYKIIRNDINNHELINKLICKTNKPIYISTGMCNAKDIDNLFKRFGNPNNRINLIHTQLSHAVEDVNLNAITYLMNKYKATISYGNHCSNLNVLYMSVAYNPYSIWFYTRGAKVNKYPDDEHAVPLKLVNDLTVQLIELQKALGSARKFKMSNKIEE